jgi:hypothetical protein
MRLAHGGISSPSILQEGAPAHRTSSSKQEAKETGRDWKLITVLVCAMLSSRTSASDEADTLGTVDHMLGPAIECDTAGIARGHRTTPGHHHDKEIICYV